MANPSIAEVCTLGVGIVFVGLVCIVLLCYVVGLFCRMSDKKSKAPLAEASAPAAASDEIPNRQEFVAAVSAALAEDMGKDISGIRILSIKRM